MANQQRRNRFANLLAAGRWLKRLTDSHLPGQSGRAGSISLQILVVLSLASCSGASGDGEAAAPDNPLPLRVYRSPYTNVDWTSDLRLKAQLHDHHGTITSRIAAYDAAGYDVLALSDYSGNRALSYAWTSRRWPAENWLSPTFIGSLRNIEVLLPGGEEVGILEGHVTSTFLETYVERWTPDLGAARQPHQYETLPELLHLVQSLGGIPCIAHPWSGTPAVPTDGPLCTEIYSAFEAYRTWQGTDEFFKTSRSPIMLAAWDQWLQRNQAIIGVAVNDHHGPYSSIAGLPDYIRDSGKIVVLSKAATASAFKEAFLSGSVFAIRDYGLIKDRYPAIGSIVTDGSSIEIDTAAHVEWVSGGRLIGTGPRLEATSIPWRSRYVRAEISNAEGSIVYTQAFWVRPVGDADGDYDVDAGDSSLCSAIRSGAGGPYPTEQIDACRTP